MCDFYQAYFVISLIFVIIYAIISALALLLNIKSKFDRSRSTQNY